MTIPISNAGYFPSECALGEASISPDTSPKKAGVKKRDVDGSPVTSPSKKLAASIHQISIDDSRLDKRIRSINDALSVHMTSTQDIVDRVGDAVKERNRHALRKALQESGTCLYEVCTDVLGYDDDEDAYLKSELKDYLFQAFTSDPMQLTSFLSAPKGSELYDLFYETLEQAPDDIKMYFTFFSEKRDSETRLKRAVAERNVQAVQETVDDFRVLGLELKVPTCSEEDATWLKNQIAVARIKHLVKLEKYIEIVPIFEEWKGKKRDEEAFHLLQTVAPEVSSFTRVLNSCRALTTELKEKKPLSLLQALQISCFVEEKFQKSGSGACILEDMLERAVILDLTKRSYIVISGKVGQLYVKGADRKVSNAALLTFTDQGAVQTRQFAALANRVKGLDPSQAKQEAEHSRRQVELAYKLYGPDIYLASEFTTSKGSSQFYVLEELYGSNLKSLCMSSQLSSAQIRILLRGIGEHVQWLHMRGYVHGDIKDENVLVHGDKVKLIDFGWTYNGKDMPMHENMLTSYGNFNATAPEFFRPHGLWTIEQGQRHDMYAFGCLMFKVLFGGEVPWDQCVRNYYGEKRQFAEGEEGKQEEEYKKLLEQIARCEDAEQKALLQLLAGLLQPIAEQRMTINQFLDALS